ncbi:sensor histidine kinase [Paludibaculum fermentans]|uniref:sensor histidine kinase n=1 Tax=Paludibaculum fermentans TaxID=1473598 RepID=UPI003EBC58B0
MHMPKGITLRITLLGWLVTLVTLAVFVMVIVPEQKREFELGLESKARGVAVSIRGVAAGAAVSEDYSSVVDQAMQVLSGDTAIDYVVVTKNDGFSIVVDRSTWKIDKLNETWRPAARTPTSSIGIVPLFGRRVFQYAFPFDYSGIQWGWIHVGLSLEAYDQSVRRTYTRTAGLAILCGCLSLLISLVYAARLVRPIQILHSAVEQVAQGDLRARADVRSRDEIQRLAEAFNDMARTILARNQILDSVSFAAKEFLSDGDGDTIIGKVLERVGQAAGTNRACVLKISSLEEGIQVALQREWVAPGEDANLKGWACFNWSGEPASGWIESLQAGNIVTVIPAGAAELLSEDIEARICSAILVPVIVTGQWWGVVCIDDFSQPREWGEAEKDSLRAVADMLGASIARHRVRTALIDAKQTLEQRVIERTKELQEQIAAKDRAHSELAAAQQRLIELSREAGMAEIATGVLHNVGNVLNSVNVSTSLVAGKIRESRVDNLVSLVGMLEQHSSDVSGFLTNDPKGQRVLPYLVKLGGHFKSERDGILQELEMLSSHVGHIKQIVATQQSYAKVSGLVENIKIPEMMDDAIRILDPGFARHGITVVRDFETLPEIAVVKHKILQILLNLLRNAKQALKEVDGTTEKTIRVCVRRKGERRMSLSVQDNGVGLPAENLTRIFGHGFTTKANGHGFGLHSCALAASEMGGSLRAESDGPGKGATFTLELPMKLAEDMKGVVT